jgi:hypothetical protein
MAKEIVVYYGVVDNTMIDDVSPALADAVANEKSLVELSKGTARNVFQCPAIKDGFDNTFVYKSPYDYSLEVTNKDVKSLDWTQEFFDKHIKLRDISCRALSITMGQPIFYTAEDSLFLEQKPPFWHSSMFNDANYFVGGFDCAKHFRVMDLAVQFRNDTKVDIKEGDALYYVKFHTDAKVKLKRFFFTPELREYLYMFEEQRDSTRKIKPLSFWYSRAKKLGYKRRVLQLLEQNSE